MLIPESVALELSQADAVSRALLADSALRDGFANRQVCLGCGRDVDRARLFIYPKATRCSLCVGFPTLARRR